MTMRWFFVFILSALTFTGCRDNSAVEGKVTITSTKAFSNNKAMKSPPPQKPGT
jgi:hypothetical protein